VVSEWWLWNGCPEALAKEPPGEEDNIVEQLVKLAGCSTDEAEAIASALDEALYNESLNGYDVIEGGVVLYHPTMKFLEEFEKLLKELHYEFEKSEEKSETTFWF